MFTTKCKGCGVVFDTDSLDKHYCTVSCYRKAYAKSRYNPEECFFNDGVMCEMRNCKKCGWNPKVSEMRLMKMLEDLK